MNFHRLLSSAFALLVIWTNSGTSGTEHDTLRSYRNNTQTTALPAKRAYGAFVDGLSVTIGIGAMIMGITCTEVGCSPDDTSEKIKELFSKVDSIESQITALQREVAEIRHDTHVKWYFDMIKIVNSEMATVADKELAKSKNLEDLAMRDKFVDQNLGIYRDDYVSKALFLIPTLVIDDKVVQHYLKYQRKLPDNDEAKAVEKTCTFAKGILDYQDDGYAALIIAYSIAFKKDRSAYDDALAETCALWRTTSSPEYVKECNKMESKLPEGIKDRRKPQKDYILKIKGLEGCSLESPTPTEPPSSVQ